MSATRGRSATGSALVSFVVTALVVCGVWWWLGAPIQIASPKASVGKPYCLSYAPFRDVQNPLVEGTRVEAAQIEQDLALLSKYTDCIRTYSVDDGRADVLESARRHGLKVLHGIWVSSDPAKTRQQIDATVALAKAYPDVIAAVVVGNEVLLRGEMSSTDLIGYIRQVKAQVPMPVTYADVWEFWLRYPDVQSAVDFVTIHVLPYWEDFPIPATRAAARVAAIRARVAAAFPGKEIVIGEFGWPSAGRMREDARPSPSNQARAILEAMALAKREHFRMNVIEAFDQPWKRELEGAVGGYWGIIDRATGAPKFSFDGTVSDHPHWVAQALAGVLLAALTFGAAFFAGREKGVSRIAMAEDRRTGACSRRPVRLGDRGGRDRQLQPGELAAFACLRRNCRRCSDRLRRRLRCRPLNTVVRLAPWQSGTPRRPRLGAGRHVDRANAGHGRSSARPGVRSALPRHSVCAADCGGGAVPGVARFDAASGGTAGGRRDGSRSGSRGLGRLYCLQRNLRQLAVGLVLRRVDRSRNYLGAGTGRAKLRMSAPPASAERSALCMTTPKAAAASDTANRMSDGRMRLSSATASATPPKT